MEGAKGLGYLERRVVRKHDAARANTDLGGFSTNSRDHDLGRGAGEQLHGVVFGHPETAVAERLDVLSEVDGIAQCLRGRGAGGYGRLVEDG